jgi:cytoskeletal protein RodZ
MARIAPFQCCAAVIAGVFRSHIVCLTEFGKSHFRNFVRRWVMLRVSPAARSRCFGFRRGVFNSVVLPALVIGAVANAQEGAQAPQRQEHETLTAPAQPQQPASGPPAASEVLVPDATAGTTQLPPIVVRGDTPKAKRDSPPQKPVAQSGRTTQRAAQSAPTTQQAAQDAPTPQQAALNTQMTTMNEARDTNILQRSAPRPTPLLARPS